MLEKWLRNTIKWLRRQKDDNIEFQSVLVSKKEGKQYHTTKDRTNIRKLTVTPPIYLLTKVIHKELATIIARQWEGVARWDCRGSIEFSLMVFETNMIRLPL